MLQGVQIYTEEVSRKKFDETTIRPQLPISVQGGEMKRNPEMGETAKQPLPAQTADLSISGLRFIFPLCTSDLLLSRPF